MRRSVRLVRWNNGNPKACPKFGRKLTIDFRSKLFSLNYYYSHQRWFRFNEQLFDRHFHSELVGIVAEGIDELVSDVGEEWADRIRSGKTYSGMSLLDVAASLGQSQLELYHSIYRLHSMSVHAGDWLHYASWQSADGLLETNGKGDSDQLEVVFRLSTLAYLQGLGRLHQAFELTEYDQERIADLLERFSGFQWRDDWC